jgi:MinD-like ATPase involved in chromosome partitioning or flagellar assembly
MALSNIAALLAHSGLKVLVVDFDLEAPGLDILASPGTPTDRPGVVEYVLAYLQSDLTPDAAEYIYRANVQSQEAGEIWVMPAGRPDASYSERLCGIDWESLYSHEDGYLLFEDLKKQWESILKFDYVLIDSRTGHTDVAGICTRQLPDAVVLLFLPNAQNLRGLQTVVADIRAEAEPPLRRDIKLHFVASNVPDLDDEDAIIARQLRAFRRDLKMTERPLVIHHYDSLSLLTQTLFVDARPRSRLAKQYQQLARRIRAENPQDTKGAIAFLDDVQRQRVIVAPEILEARLQSIERAHHDDGDVLCQIGKVRLSRNQAAEALALFQRSLDSGLETASVFAALARARNMIGDRDGAVEAALAVFERTDATINDLSPALELIRNGSPHAVVGLSRKPAVQSLAPEHVEWLATNLNRSREELTEARGLFESLLAQGGLANQERIRGNTLPLCLIGLGDFRTAMALLEEEYGTYGRKAIAGAFNYAMATWGAIGEPNPELFAGVLNLEARSKIDGDANYYQCLAVAAWVVGDVARASQFLERSSEHAKPAVRCLSCWRYLSVPQSQFLRDLEQIRRLMAGESVKPAFLQDAAPQIPLAL